MKNLTKIIEKYSQISHNADNYEIGGGLDSNKFASRRHEDAKNDFGKLTLGKAVQMFKKAVGVDDVEFIKEVLHYAVPSMEWHHAGKLPKAYGATIKTSQSEGFVFINIQSFNKKNTLTKYPISELKKVVKIKTETEIVAKAKRLAIDSYLTENNLFF